MSNLETSYYTLPIKLSPQLKRIRESSQIKQNTSWKKDKVQSFTGELKQRRIVKLSSIGYFNPRELEARIKAIFRRSDSNENSNTQVDTSIIVNGNLKMNTSNREIFVSDNKIETTTTEYEILRVLLEHKGKVVDREQLMKMARGQEWMAYDRSVDVHISNLRKKLGSVHLIKTIHGVGYLSPLA